MQTNIFLNVHLISDSTGETLNAVLRAVAPLFEHVTALERSYYLVRSRRQLDKVLEEIESRPGVVLFTIASQELRLILEEKCKAWNIPCQSLLDSTLDLFSRHLGIVPKVQTGMKQTLDSNYFRRIEAMNYTMSHDDGQIVNEYDDADIVLVGISRTSKTPTSIYLANRGYKTANYPLVHGGPIPEVLLELKKPLVVGLKVSPDRLIAIRTNRLLSLNAEANTDYVSEDAVREEVIFANRLFERQGWPVIDVTRRSIEETAAAVLNLVETRNREQFG
ncbi:pyruvate, water dikinase regulatory protein [Pseudaquidulcibacter saccharophilus]|uniref:pyruvate, water dikinase regulatory protein n=1 Tax=Pseudaquidulcibacter saccharophilus TaxID=2831900 RepID=UPI001EFF0E62|nr:pyruvate, water dikinase regulatory protein [Pseudaquidulcibacter saccharophilus]